MAPFRPVVATAETVSLRLGGVDGCLVNPAEMYKNLKKEIAALTEELAREKAARQESKTELAKLRNSLARRNLEQAKLKKDLDEERDLRKRVEKKADEKIKAARQDFETELARRELEQAELEKELDEERYLRRQAMALVQKPVVQVESPSIRNGIYVIKNRTGDIYWSMSESGRVYFWNIKIRNYRDCNAAMKVNEHSFPIIQVFKG